MAIEYGVVKVNGAEPETFMVIGIDRMDASPIKSMSRGMSEKELRDFLKQNEVPEVSIAKLIEEARANPK